MNSRLIRSILFAAACQWCGAADPDDLIPHRQDRPPNKPYSPEEALAKMTVPEGFRVELVASEPDIVNPIAMAFDDRGWIWITESLEYPRKSAGPGRDRVKILQDNDLDGRADKIHTFAEGLNIPTGVAWGHGGVWVVNAPDLLFMREREGQEVSREVVVTGFGRTDTHELPNSLTWGPDGWLYGLNGVFNQSRVLSKNGKEYSFTCAMWRLNPRTREFQIFAEGTSNPYGIAWDREGSAIIEVCHWANDHLFHFVETGYYQRQAGAYPPFTMRIGSITDHGHQKTAYCGIALLEMDTYPEQYRGRICVGNIHGGAINLDRLQRDGATYLAKAEPDLLNANDAWFMPVSLKVGPDGCLYILDWYDRYHCSQDAARDPGGVDRLRGRLYRLRYRDTPRAPKFDLAGESDEQLIGRLASPNIFYRESAQRILTERAGKGSVELRVKLERTAEGREKKPRKQTAEIDKNQALVLETDPTRAQRLHALWALIGRGSLEPAFHQRLFNHDDPTFRAWAVRAAGNSGTIGSDIREAVARLAGDPSPDVQLQVAVAARKIQEFDALAALVNVLVQCGADKLIPAIVWPNLHPLLEADSARFLALLKSADRTLEANSSIAQGRKAGYAASVPAQIAPAVAMLMPRVLGRLLSARALDAKTAAGLLEYSAERSSDHGLETLAAISAKIAELNEAAVGQLKQELGPVIEKLLRDDLYKPAHLSARLLAGRLGLTAVDAEETRRKFLASAEPDNTRLEALEALILFDGQALLDSLPEVLSSASPNFTSAALIALGRLNNPILADIILSEYRNLASGLQPLAIDLLMQREPWARKLLDAVLAGRLPKGVLNANHLRKILESNDREAVWAVEKAFGTIRAERNPEREKVVVEMAEFLRMNLGDPVAGRRVFHNLCGQCHAIHGEGANLAPDITANGRASFEQLLSNVFDPSLVIGPAYQVTTVVTKDGRNLTGLIAEDNEHRVVVRLPGEGEEAVPRNQIKYTRASKLSMMPEGLETTLAPQELSDLFAFLSLDKPPTDPTAKPIPGAPPVSRNGNRPEGRIKLKQAPERLNLYARLPAQAEWRELATLVMDPKRRPYLHPVRDASGEVVLTEDRPADHPWQHGIFTGFHRVNGFNYWKEDEGQQRFVHLLNLQEAPDRVSWRALVEFEAPGGGVVLEEEDLITVHAPESADAYIIDFDLLLKTREKEVNFGKFFVGGLSVRMPWDKANPRQTHLNSEGLRGRDCEQKRAAWCNVERPFGREIFGVAVFDHPGNPNHPPGWRVDEQGLINPNISALSDWSIPSRQKRLFRYRLLIYRGSATRDQLAARFNSWADQPKSH